MGEVSPYVSTPRCARVCHYPLRGDTPRRPVQFLAKQDFAAALALAHVTPPRRLFGSSIRFYPQQVGASHVLWRGGSAGSPRKRRNERILCDGLANSRYIAQNNALISEFGEEARARGKLPPTKRRNK